VLKRSKFEVTPILVGDKLVACTPFNAVMALDPGTGRELCATTLRSKPIAARLV
jgi:glucose dehydrogenase